MDLVDQLPNTASDLDRAQPPRLQRQPCTARRDQPGPRPVQQRVGSRMQQEADLIAQKW
jgi:hypothetical protein